MKADFEKWLTDHEDDDTERVGFEIVNQFAEEYAKQENAELIKRIKELENRGLPDSIQEALNSGDGVYRP